MSYFALLFLQHLQEAKAQGKQGSVGLNDTFMGNLIMNRGRGTEY